MSRHSYVDDEEYPGQFALYRQRVARALRGKRGQKFLRELAAELDAMPLRELGRGGLVDEESGKACTLGVAALCRGVDAETLMSVEDCEHNEYVSKLLDIAECMAAEIAYENDEHGIVCVGGPVSVRRETDAERWTRMRAWVREQLREAP